VLNVGFMAIVAGMGGGNVNTDAKVEKSAKQSSQCTCAPKPATHVGCPERHPTASGSLLVS